MGDERLYGIPGAEEMHFDLATAYENQIEPWIDEVDAPTEKREIEEWTVRPAGDDLPSVNTIIEWVGECAADGCYGDESYTDNIDQAGRHPDVLAAFATARDLWASKITYRMADRLVRTWTITWDADSNPLADGEPIYGTKS